MTERPEGWYGFDKSNDTNMIGPYFRFSEAVDEAYDNNRSYVGYWGGVAWSGWESAEEPRVVYKKTHIDKIFVFTIGFLSALILIWLSKWSS